MSLSSRRCHSVKPTAAGKVAVNELAATEYEGQRLRTIRKGDCILQTPGIKHREIACPDDFEVLEIVSPADFKTRVVEAPTAQTSEELTEPTLQYLSQILAFG